jgi:hypothetical protein
LDAQLIIGFDSPNPFGVIPSLSEPRLLAHRILAYWSRSYRSKISSGDFQSSDLQNRLETINVHDKYPLGHIQAGFYQPIGARARGMMDETIPRPARASRKFPITRLGNI